MNKRPAMRQYTGIGLKMAGVVSAVLIAAALLAWWTVGQAEAVGAARAQAVSGEAGDRPVLFLGNQSLPPMNYMKNGKPTGIVVDLVESLAERMHHPVKIQLMNWSEAQQLVLQGRADALFQIDSNPDRLKALDFSEPLLATEFTIFTSADRYGIATMRDLRGLKVGVEERGLPILLLKEDPQIGVKIIPDFVRGFGMLATGAVDAVIADRWVGSYVLAENNIQGVKLIEEPISRSHSAIAVKKGDKNLLEDINAALADIRRDGTYDGIIDRWRSKEVVFKTREQLRKQVWLLSAILAALIVALIGVAMLVMEIRRRKRAEETLREREEKFRRFFEEDLTGDFITNGNGTIIECNSAFLKVFGYKDRSEIINQNISSLYQDPSERDFILDQLRMNGKLENYQTTRKHQNGGWIIVEENIAATFDKDGKLTEVKGYIYDITDRKRAEEERERLIVELKTALAEVKTLRGFIPICSSCKKIRDDEGYWQQVEKYVQDRSDAQFSHGICPECLKKLYPEFYPNNEN